MYYILSPLARQWREGGTIEFREQSFSPQRHKEHKDEEHGASGRLPTFVFLAFVFFVSLW
jgi:hypothetical protein